MRLDCPYWPLLVLTTYREFFALIVFSKSAQCLCEWHRNWYTVMSLTTLRMSGNHHLFYNQQQADFEMEVVSLAAKQFRFWCWFHPSITTYLICRINLKYGPIKDSRQATYYRIHALYVHLHQSSWQLRVYDNTLQFNEQLAKILWTVTLSGHVVYVKQTMLLLKLKACFNITVYSTLL